MWEQSRASDNQGKPVKIAELDNHHEGGGVAFTGLHGDNVSMAMRPKVTPCASFFFFFFSKLNNIHLYDFFMAI